LYQPILDSPLSKEHEWIMPFLNGGGQSPDTKAILQSVNLVVAEVTFSHTAQGIELGWADMLGKPILCYYRRGYPASANISMITNHIYPYKDPQDLILQLEAALSTKPTTATAQMPEQIIKGVN
jgi:hypothetical protein